MAGGIAVGAAGGALAEPLLGWPGLFLAVAPTDIAAEPSRAVYTDQT